MGTVEIVGIVTGIIGSIGVVAAIWFGFRPPRKTEEAPDEQKTAERFANIEGQLKQLTERLSAPDASVPDTATLAAAAAAPGTAH